MKYAHYGDEILKNLDMEFVVRIQESLSEKSTALSKLLDLSINWWLLQQQNLFIKCPIMVVCRETPCKYFLLGAIYA